MWFQLFLVQMYPVGGVMIRPCDCGETDIICEQTNIEFNGDESYCFELHCSKCGLGTKFYESREEAVDAWGGKEGLAIMDWNIQKGVNYEKRNQ